METSRRYWLFSGVNYYPSGGISDLSGTYDTPLDAVRFLSDICPDWFQIVDSHSTALICRGDEYYANSGTAFGLSIPDLPMESFSCMADLYKACEKHLEGATNGTC